MKSDDFLGSELGDGGARDEWIRGLNRCEDGIRLACSLGIDLKSGALASSTIRDIVDYAVTVGGSLDSRRRFGRGLEGHPERERFIRATAFSSSPLAAGDHYVTVVDLLKFVTQYAGPSLGYDSSPDSIAEIKRRYCSNAAGTSLEDINIVSGLKAGLVWVGSWQQLYAEEVQYNGFDCASRIKDRLGLARPGRIPPGAEYFLLAIRYPEDFAEPCYQPTSLVAYWTEPGQFYLSYRYDGQGWGRTCSCSAGGEHMLERVHASLASLGKGFTAVPIGLVTSENIDRAALEKESQSRFDRV